MKQKAKRMVRATFFTLAIMAIPLLIVGCQKEDLGTENPANQKIRAFEEIFTLENFNAPFIKENVTVDWNAYSSEETDNGTVYEFNTQLKEKQFIENGEQQFYTLYKLLVTEDDGETNLQLLKFFTNDRETLDGVDYFNMEGFSGTLFYYGLDGRNTKIAVYEDGEVISEFEDKGHGAITEQSKAPVTYCEDCPEGGYVLILTEHYTDYYVSWNGGDFTYSYSVYTGTTSEWVWVPGTGSSGGGSINPTSHSHYDYSHGPSAGTNNHPDENIFEFDSDLVLYGNGVKPLYEYNNKCTGITQMWQLSQNSGNEFAAVLTSDGAILITQQLNPSSGGVSGIYEYNGVTYYQYPTSQGAPARTYQGQIQVAGRYFIPITATIHSHTPCINDGTDGISNNIINDDQNFAANYPSANHYIIGCNSVGQFNGNSNQAFNIQNGSLSSLCNNIN